MSKILISKIQNNMLRRPLSKRGLKKGIMDRKRSFGCFHTFTVAFHAYFRVRLSKGFAKLHQKCCDKISNIRKSAGYPGDYLCRISGPTLLIFICQVITSVPDMNAGDVSLAVDAANDAFQVSLQI